MAGLIWLASYPKSGNTWVRILLHNYDNLPGNAANINHLGTLNAAEHSLFDRFGIVDASELTDDELQALRPSLFRTIAASAREDVLLKVHDAFGSTPGGEPIFPRDVTRAVVYLVRSPLDVAVAFSRHFGMSVDDAVSRLCDGWSLGSGSQCRQQLRSWSAHVTSWVDQSDMPVCLVRYEDLLVDASAEFARIVAAIGRPIDESRLSVAVDHSRFERLQEQERAGGFIERLPQATAPFFATGRSGGWRDHLEADHVRQLIDAHGSLMQRFGYLSPGGEPVY